MNGSLLLYLALAYPVFYVLYFLVIALAGRLYRPPQLRTGVVHRGQHYDIRTW